ncbi:phosphatidate cytidylyltransferase [Roseovarius ramblicola]|uniref:Phosphatidate cytidylyltransferase n=1 Tax=Roseovarius ramblicola TaxID=2022336 RepID=A0ABV5I303_9RHOB
MNAGARWSDLAPRVASGLVMAAVGLGAIWAGGAVFAALVVALGGLMTWEAARLYASAAPERAAITGAVALALALVLPGMFVLPLAAAAVLVNAETVARARAPFAALALAALLAPWVIHDLRADEAGLTWVLWLVLVVIVSDVAGYFAGKAIGGPKFWPSISPKKTWSGTIAGWVGAACIGAVFAGPTGAGVALIPVSVLVGFAGQMGDIAESAVKRMQGVKDSSALIPGHGGVLDRFDAMLGAGLAVGLLRALGLV